MDNRSLTEIMNDLPAPPLPGLPQSAATLAAWKPTSPAMVLGMMLFCGLGSTPRSSR